MISLIFREKLWEKDSHFAHFEQKDGNGNKDDRQKNSGHLQGHLLKENFDHAPIQSLLIIIEQPNHEGIILANMRHNGCQEEGSKVSDG